MQSTKCGTRPGYLRHSYYKETPCEPCVEANKVACRIWYQKNKEQKKLYQINQKTHEYKAKWQKNNPEKVAINSKKWRAENKDSVNRNTARRKARMANNEFEIYSVKQVLDLYGVNCHICGLKIDFNAPRKVGIKNWEFGLQIDHVIPIVKGGPDTLNNVRPAHGLCNIKKKDKTEGK